MKASFIAVLFAVLLSLSCSPKLANATYIPCDGDIGGGEVGADDEFVYIVGTIAFAAAHHVLQEQIKRRCGGRGEPIKRQRRDVESIIYELGPSYVKRYLRMDIRTFWKLVRILKEKLDPKEYYYTNGKKRKRTAPNGVIKVETKVAVALRYMSGGDPNDIQLAFGISHSEIFPILWDVVDAINELPYFNIEYPKDHNEQRRIAREFRDLRSRAGFDVCAGAIDGLIVWTLKPTTEDLKAHGNCPATKFFCSRKHKFGLNMQAVCDARRRFLYVNMDHPAATSDYMAYVTSPLCHMIEQGGFLAPGLCLFGDNAYANNETMAIPFRNVSFGDKDSYNFYHSQVRINIECAFGILVRRFGLLRRAMPDNISINKTRSLVQAMCKIHNYCIDNDDDAVAEATGPDELHIIGEAGIDRLTGLIDGSNHRDDHDHRRLDQRDNNRLPRELLLERIIESGMTRRVPPSWRQSEEMNSHIQLSG